MGHWNEKTLLKIIETKGNVLIYGSRQMGETTLLKEISEEYDKHTSKQVIYLGKNNVVCNLFLKFLKSNNVDIGIIGDERYLEGMDNCVIMVDSDDSYVKDNILKQTFFQKTNIKTIYTINRDSSIPKHIYSKLFNIIINLNENDNVSYYK